jgi:hypothetical protein
MLADLTVDYVCDVLNLTKNELRDFLHVDSRYTLEEALKKEKFYLHYSIATIYRVEDWAGSRESAVNWFMNDHIPAFCCTAQQAALNGHYDAVDEYLTGIEFGGFA